MPVGIAAVLAAVACFAPSAEAIGPGDQIAYSCGGYIGDTTGQICVMRPGGSQGELLVGRGRSPRSAHPDGLTAPAWSSDGGQVAFVGRFHESSGPDRSQLYRVNADGTGLRSVGRPLPDRSLNEVGLKITGEPGSDGLTIGAADEAERTPIAWEASRSREHLVDCGALPSRRPPTSIAALIHLLRLTPGSTGAGDPTVGVAATSPQLDGGELSLLALRPRVIVRDRGRERTIPLRRAKDGYRGRLPAGATSCRLSAGVTDPTFLRYYGPPRPRTFRFPCHPPRGEFYSLRTFGVPGPVVRYAF